MRQIHRDNKYEGLLKSYQTRTKPTRIPKINPNIIQNSIIFSKIKFIKINNKHTLLFWKNKSGNNSITTISMGTCDGNLIFFPAILALKACVTKIKLQAGAYYYLRWFMKRQ